MKEWVGRRGSNGEYVGRGKRERIREEQLRLRAILGVVWKPNTVESSLMYTYKKVITWKFQNNERDRSLTGHLYSPNKAFDTWHRLHLMSYGQSGS